MEPFDVVRKPVTSPLSLMPVAVALIALGGTMALKWPVLWFNS